MADLSGPAHVGDMEKTVDAFLDLDERAVVGEIPDGSLDHGARRVLAGNLIPGVHLGLLHAQGDFLLLLVDAEDDDFDLVANLHQLARMIDSLRPRHLGDVDKPLDPFLELDERAIGHDVDDFAHDAGGDRVLVGDVFPGAGALLLEAKRDLLAVLVDMQHHHLDLVVDLDHVAGVVDAAPTHVGDVQETVDAAKVDERAEVGDVLDRADANLPRLDFGEQLLLLLFAGDLDELTTRDDDVASAFVDLEDHALDIVLDVVGNIARAANIDLARGQEDVDADVDEQASLDLSGDLALDHVAFVVLRDDHLPSAHAMRLLAGENDLACLVLHPLKEDLDGVARLGRGLVFPLVERNKPFRLVADVNDDLITDDLDDLAGDNPSDIEVLSLLVEEPVEIIRFAVGRNDRRQLLFRDIKFAKQVAIYHGNPFRSDSENRAGLNSQESRGGRHDHHKKEHRRPRISRMRSFLFPSSSIRQRKSTAHREGRPNGFGLGEEARSTHADRIAGIKYCNKAFSEGNTRSRITRSRSFLITNNEILSSACSWR